MPKKIVVSDDVAERMYADFRDGVTLRELVEKYGYSYWKIRDTFTKREWSMQRWEEPDGAFAEVVRQLYEDEGLTIEAVAKRTGKARSYVHVVMKNWGIKRRGGYSWTGGVAVNNPVAALILAVIGQAKLDATKGNEDAQAFFQDGGAYHVYRQKLAEVYDVNVPIKQLPFQIGEPNN